MGEDLLGQLGDGASGLLRETGLWLDCFDTEGRKFIDELLEGCTKCLRAEGVMVGSGDGWWCIGWIGVGGL